MTRSKLILRSLGYYWRTHLGVLAGAVIATAVLVGALAIGDSVRYSLRRQALSRLGDVHLAMMTRDRFFRQQLAREVSARTDAPAAAAISLIATATDASEQHRAGTVDLLGVDANFAALRPQWTALKDLHPGEIVLNRRLAEELHVGPGDDVVIRFDNPTLISGDLPISSEENATVFDRLTVAAVLEGGFSLLANQVTPGNAIVPLEWIQRKLNIGPQANTVLLGAPAGAETFDPNVADAAVRDAWTLDDAELTFRRIPDQNVLEMRSGRVFLSPAVSDAAALADANRPTGVFTYFVNTLGVGDRTTPYSMVSGLGPLRDVGRATPPVPAALDANEIVINQWLADDLDAAPGDPLELTYYVISTSKDLATASRSFRIARVAPIEGDANDPTLMPNFPGLAGAKNCRDWKLGDAVDFGRIEKEDEAYWNRYRGTPKAFVPLQAARSMWGNRFGNLTSVRWPLDETDANAVSASLQEKLDPAAIGLFFLPVREQALEASKGASDFGQIFIGLSFFLIAAALALMGLLFAFGIQQRTAQVGTLLAVGWTPWRVRGLLLAEGSLLAVLGALGGMLAGPWYARFLLEQMAGVWSGAIADARIEYYASPVTLVVGALIGALAAVVAMLLALYRQAGRSPHELLAGGGDAMVSRKVALRGGRYSAVLSGVCFVGAGAMLAWGLGDRSAATGAFFGVGALLLTALLAAAHSLLARMGHSRSALKRISALALRNASRRRGRSLATIGILAAGAFLVVTVAANRMTPLQDAGKRDSGTGGFAFWAESALPITRDLNDPNAREVYRLDRDLPPGVRFVNMRVRQGDDASCLNLNQAQQPRLFGVNPESLASRAAFAFAQTMKDVENPWLLLKGRLPDGSIPAIADTETLLWAIHKQVGESITYTDDRGRPFRVTFVAATTSSVLQGVVLIGEENFVRKYPSIEGYRAFLIDAPEDGREQITDELEKAMLESGLEVTATVDRLGSFMRLVNTYLTMFGALGGVGLLLGSLGLGVVVLRNVLERRGELGLLRAVGFSRLSLGRMIVLEHWMLCVVGLVMGTAAAIIAVVPAIRSAGGSIPLGLLSVVLGLIVLNGCVWAAVASAVAVGRGNLLDALRTE